MNVNKQQRSCSTRNRRLPLFSILEPLSSLTKPIPSIAIAVNQVFVVYSKYSNCERERDKGKKSNDSS